MSISEAKNKLGATHYFEMENGEIGLFYKRMENLKDKDYPAFYWFNQYSKQWVRSNNGLKWHLEQLKKIEI